MATLLTALAACGSRKTDGSVNAGGRVFLSVPGAADTRVTGYADRDKSAVISLDNGGILLDAAGKRQVWVDQPAAVREEDADGALIAAYSAGTDVSAALVEVQNAGFLGTDADGAQAAGGRTYLETVLSRLVASPGGLDGNYRGVFGTVDRPISDELDDIFINVRRFGSNGVAVGTGVGDDTTAVQNAFNAQALLGGGTVYFPPGIYRVSGVTATGSNLTIKGAGPTASKIVNISTTATAITITGSHVTVSDIGIGTATTTFATQSSTVVSTGTGISFSASGNNILQNVVIYNHRTGVSGLTLASLNGVYVFMALSDASAVGFSGDFRTSVLIGCLATGDASNGTGYSYSDTAATVGPVFLGNVAALVNIGFDFAGTGGGATMVGCKSLGAATTDLRMAAGTGRMTIVGSTFDVVSDGRTGSPVKLTRATTGTLSPLPMQSPATLLVGTAGGITITVGGLATAPHGTKHTIICSNASGGAVTWAVDAGIILSATGVPAPADGTGIAIGLVYSATAAKWKEEFRSAAVAN